VVTVQYIIYNNSLETNNLAQSLLYVMLLCLFSFWAKQYLKCVCLWSRVYCIFKPLIFKMTSTIYADKDNDCTIVHLRLALRNGGFNTHTQTHTCTHITGTRTGATRACLACVVWALCWQSRGSEVVLALWSAAGWLARRSVMTHWPLSGPKLTCHHPANRRCLRKWRQKGDGSSLWFALVSPSCWWGCLNDRRIDMSYFFWMSELGLCRPGSVWDSHLSRGIQEVLNLFLYMQRGATMSCCGPSAGYWPMGSVCVDICHTFLVPTVSGCRCIYERYQSKHKVCVFYSLYCTACCVSLLLARSDQCHIYDLYCVSIQWGDAVQQRQAAARYLGLLFIYFMIIF